MFSPGLRLSFGGFGALDSPKYFLTLLLVERKRFDPNDNLICVNGVALFQFDAQHTAGNGSGDDETVMRSCFAVFIHGDTHGAAGGLGDLDKNRSRTQQDPDECSDSKRECR